MIELDPRFLLQMLGWTASGRGGGGGEGARGKAIGCRAPAEPGRFPTGLSLFGSVSAMADRLAAPRESASPAILPEDLRERRLLSPGASLLVFLVDTSDSMGASAGLRISIAKGAILTWFRQARRRRDQVALIGFGGGGADLLLPPTHSMQMAQQRLRGLATGGATPLPAGLRAAYTLIRSMGRKDADLQPVLILLSDGEANVSIDPFRSAEAEAMEWAARLGARRIRSLVVDVGGMAREADFLRRLTRELGGRLYQIPVARVTR